MKDFDTQDGYDKWLSQHPDVYHGTGVKMTPERMEQHNKAYRKVWNLYPNDIDMRVQEFKRILGLDFDYRRS